MPATSSLFPGNPLTLNGNQEVTIDLLMQQPDMIADMIESLPVDYQFANAFFSPGDAAVGGAVLFEQYLNGDFRLTDRDVQAIEPGAEFPEVGLQYVDAKTTQVTKWGGQATVTIEHRKRSRRDVVEDRLRVLGNTIALKTSNVCLGRLNSDTDVQTFTAGTAWTAGGSDPFADINLIVEKIRVVEIDSDYETAPIIAVANTKLRRVLANNANVRALLPRETQNMLTAGVDPLGVVEALGIRWRFSNRQADGTIHVGIEGKYGKIHPENLFEGEDLAVQGESGLFTQIVPQPLNQSHVVLAGRVFVPSNAHPKSVVKVTGVM